MGRRTGKGRDHLYLQVAEGLEKMIGDEVLKIGDKLPSVRMLSQEQGISMGTAFQAYYHLEGKGLIESRPKSGYYVRFNHRRFPHLPKISDPEPRAFEVSVEEMISRVFSSLSTGDLMNFSVAAPPLELLPAARLNKAMVFALRNAKHYGISYEHVQGNPELRRQLRKLFFTWGGRFSEDEIVITAGCMEALTMSLRAVTRPGDTVAIESPTYFGIFQLIESLGLKALEIPTDPLTGVDISYLSGALRKFPVKACVFVTNFSNPMGGCMPDGHKEKLVDLVTRYQIPLIEDDIYGELYFGKHRPRTCKSFDTRGWVIYCGSLSKSLAPGYRIGWVIPGLFSEKIISLKMIYTITGTSLTQAAIAHFLSIGRYEYHLKKLRKALHTQCLRYVQGILEHFPADTKVSRPQGGFVLWLELNKKINAYELYHLAVKQQISVAPGQVFSSSGQFSHCLRISYAKPWDARIDRALKTLGDLVKKLMR